MTHLIGNFLNRRWQHKVHPRQIAQGDERAANKAFVHYAYARQVADRFVNRNGFAPKFVRSLIVHSLEVGNIIRVTSVADRARRECKSVLRVVRGNVRLLEMSIYQRVIIEHVFAAIFFDAHPFILREPDPLAKNVFSQPLTVFADSQIVVHPLAHSGIHRRDLEILRAFLLESATLACGSVSRPERRQVEPSFTGRLQVQQTAQKVALYFDVRNPCALEPSSHAFTVAISI